MSFPSNSNMVGSFSSDADGSNSFFTGFQIIGTGDDSSNFHFNMQDTTCQINISHNGNPEFTVNSHAILFNVDSWSVTSTSAGGSMTWSTAGVLTVMNSGAGFTITPSSRTIDVGTSASLTLTGAANLAVNISAASGSLQIAGTQVVAARNTGWTAWTGTAAKGTFDTATATLVNCAQTIKAITDALRLHGLIGT